MKILQYLIKALIGKKYKRISNMVTNPIASQENMLSQLVQEAKSTQFGKDHSFNAIHNYEDFKRYVPLRSYEALKPYFEKVKSGEKNILWKGRPAFLGKTSGTTSKVKYIPVTKDSLKNQIDAPQYTAVNYAFRYKKYDFLKGKILLFSDGHFFEKTSGIRTAPISTIANSCVPFFYKWLRLPSNKINAIPLYEKRIKAMIKASMGKDIRTIVAMPVWLLIFLRALKQNTGKEFKQLFPNFQLLLLSGMNFEPFLPEIKKYIDLPFDILETYPSTEGFIAYQDDIAERGMQLVLNDGIFFEFIPEKDLYKDPAKRISLKDVVVDVDYALILNTTAGLWGYIIGDTIRFKSIVPHRIVITGRINVYLSSFGEHITQEETDIALTETAIKYNTGIAAYTVAPVFMSDKLLPYHEWFIEFGHKDFNLNDFAETLNDKICQRNFSYKDLYSHKAILPLKITCVQMGGFEKVLKSLGKTGFQYKIPVLKNDYQFAAELKEILSMK